MSIPEVISFDKDGAAESARPLSRARELVRPLFLTIVILLTATLSFGIGRLTSGGAGEPVRIEYDPNLSAAAVPVTGISPKAGEPAPLEAQFSNGVVASKSGSKYHYPSCPGAKQIKESNKISFPNAQAAEAAGYTLAVNCKGP